MSVVTIEEELRLPYAPQDLCALVGDVRSYPDFIRYVQSIEVPQETPLEGGGWEGLARASIGWRQITERFATWVKCRPDLGEVEVRLAEGPFRRLENRWWFKPGPQGGSVVRFWIAYEFKNPLLQALAKVNRRLAADRIMGAFVAEAHRRFGGDRPAAGG